MPPVVDRESAVRSRTEASGGRTMTDNVHRMLSPLLIISYVVGTRIVQFPAGNPRPRLGLPYMLLLWTVYHFLLVCTVLSYVSYYSTEYHICFWLNSVTVQLSILLGLYYDKKFRRCLKKLAIVDDTLERLGTMTDYQQLRARIMSAAIVWSVLVTLITFGKSIWYMTYSTVIKAIYISFILEYYSHVNLNSDLIIVSVLGYIGLKFDQINELLRKLDRHEVKPAWNTVLLPQQFRCPNSTSAKYTTWIVMHLHLELCKISREINSMFGLQMVLKMGCYFAFVAIDFREIFNVTLIDDYISRKALFIYLIMFSLILYICRLLLINYICERVSGKANETGNFINKIAYSTRDSEVRENISQFLLQIRQSPLRFYGLRLFQFGSRFIYGFTRSVATVIVILVQGHTNTNCCRVKN